MKTNSKIVAELNASMDEALKKRSAAEAQMRLTFGAGMLYAYNSWLDARPVVPVYSSKELVQQFLEELGNMQSGNKIMQSGSKI